MADRFHYTEENLTAERALLDQDLADLTAEQSFHHWVDAIRDGANMLHEATLAPMDADVPADEREAVDRWLCHFVEGLRAISAKFDEQVRDGLRP